MSHYPTVRCNLFTQTIRVWFKSPTQPAFFLGQHTSGTPSSCFFAVNTDAPLCQCHTTLRHFCCPWTSNAQLLFALAHKNRALNYEVGGFQWLKCHPSPEFLWIQASGWVHAGRWKRENLGWNLWAKHTFCTLSSLPVREPWTLTLQQTQLIGAKCSALEVPMTSASFHLPSICNPLKHIFRQWLAWGSSRNVFNLIFSKLWRHKLLIYCFFFYSCGAS